MHMTDCIKFIFIRQMAALVLAEVLLSQSFLFEEYFDLICLL